MLNELRKIVAFIKRDFRVLLTYKLAFSMAFLTIIFNFFYLILFGNMFGSRELSILMPYGGDFISYILIGSIGWGFLWSVMSSTAASIRTEMMMGTLESILLTPTKIYTVIIAYTFFGCFFGLISIGILSLVGIFLFGITVFETANIFTLIIFMLSTFLMMGFGMIFGGLTIWLKNIGETISLMQSITMLFSGVYFPITVLPVYLQPIAKCIPFYYSIEGLRKSLLITTSTSEIIQYISTLLLLSITFIILGIFTLHLGIKKAKKDGSLSFY